LRTTGAERKPLGPFDLSYVADDSSQGFIAFRPAAAFRRSGMGLYRTMVNVLIGQQWAKAANAMKSDPTKPSQGPLRVEMFEELAFRFRFYAATGKKPNGRLAFGDVITVRTTAPVDWVTLFRAFAQGPVETRDGDRLYYKLKSRWIGPDACFFCPDDRTLVCTDEKRLLALFRRPIPPPPPVFAQGKDWDRMLRGLLVVALDNRGGRLTKVFKEEAEQGEVDPTTSALEHADLWAFGIDDADEVVFRGVGTCPGADASESTARAIRSLLDRARKLADTPEPKTAPNRADYEKAYRMAREFIEKMRVERDGDSILVRSAGLGTLADFASLVAAGVVNF
jgi:hypothetical protein